MIFLILSYQLIHDDFLIYIPQFYIVWESQFYFWNLHKEIILVQCIWSAWIVLKKTIIEKLFGALVSLDLDLNSRAPRNIPYTHSFSDITFLHKLYCISKWQNIVKWEQNFCALGRIIYIRAREFSLHRGGKYDGISIHSISGPEMTLWTFLISFISGWFVFIFLIWITLQIECVCVHHHHITDEWLIVVCVCVCRKQWKINKKYTFKKQIFGMMLKQMWGTPHMVLTFEQDTRWELVIILNFYWPLNYQ